MSEYIKSTTKRRYLLCLSNDAAYRKTEIMHDFFVVGSKSDADLKIETEDAISNHALIRLSGDFCYIKLLHPYVTVIINKNKLQPNEMRALRSQDNLMFGSVGFRYVEQV